MLTISKLTKEYPGDDGVGTRALRGISFGVRPGEFVAIMGPSGSGKSTLLHILSFLDRPTSGSYEFFGKQMGELGDIELARIRNAKMGFVFQSFNLLGRSSVYENVELPLLYGEVPSEARSPRIKNAVAAVGLTEKLHTEASSLSGGQKQRIAIARALVNSPDVIFADEPTGNLDSESGAQIMKILVELNKEGKTVILVTHETYTADHASRLIRLKDGLIESDETITKKQVMFFK